MSLSVPMHTLTCLCNVVHYNGRSCIRQCSDVEVAVSCTIPKHAAYRQAAHRLQHLTHKSRSNSQHHLVASQQCVITHSMWGMQEPGPSALYSRLQAAKTMKPMPAFLATAGSIAMPHTSIVHTKTV